MRPDRHLVALLLGLLALAAAAPSARAEDLRGDVPVARTDAERLTRHATPRWAELATQGRASCCPAPEPCCLPSEIPCGDPCRWHGTVSLTGWVPGIRGDMTVRGRDAAIDTTPMDVLENLDKLESIFQGRVALHRGRWGFELAGLTVRFEDTLELREQGQPIQGGIGLDVLEAQVSYCLRRCPVTLGCGQPSCPSTLAYEAYAGVRYMSMQLELARGGGRVQPAVRRVQDWLDPLVGGRVTLDLGNRWAFYAAGDVGGFGLASDFAWNVVVGARYRPWRRASFDLGFKATGIDYSTGAGTDRFRFDATLWGPYLAVNFHF